jgi:hypothetical protein
MDANIVTTQFTAAAIFVWGMQRLKAAPWFPLLQQEGQRWIKRCTSIVTAFFVHTEISHVWSPGKIEGSHVLIISIPPFAVIAVSVWHWLGQYAMQEVMYQATLNRAGNGSQTTLTAGGNGAKKAA